MKIKFEFDTAVKYGGKGVEKSKLLLDSAEMGTEKR